MSTTGKPTNDANVIMKINEGGNGIAAYGDVLSAEEKTNLIAFLKTLHPWQNPLPRQHCCLGGAGGFACRVPAFYPLACAT